MTRAKDAGSATEATVTGAHKATSSEQHAASNTPPATAANDPGAVEKHDRDVLELLKIDTRGLSAAEIAEGTEIAARLSREDCAGGARVDKAKAAADWDAFRARIEARGTGESSERPRSWRDTIRVHPAAEMIPPMAPEELRALAEDIKEHGITVPIVFWAQAPGLGYSLLDGRSRLDAAELAGIKL